MESIGFIPTYVHIWTFAVSQTLIASMIVTLLFVLMIVFYTILKRTHRNGSFVHAIDGILEGVMSFFQDIAGHDIPPFVVVLTIFVFIYILFVNLVWLVWDLFVWVVPSLEEYFRPASTDIFFNMALAWFCIIASIIYGFKKNGWHYIEKYIWFRWIGIVPKVNSFATFVWKILDIVVALFIGLIEAISEVSRILSLSLRLFWNILAGMVLLWMIVTVSMSLFKIPLLLPLVVVLFELFVWFLQAFVFSLLVMVYFKIAWESHH